MKKYLFCAISFVLCAALTSSCGKDEAAIDSPLPQTELSQLTDLQLIQHLGFDIETAVDCGNHYLVEGDIRIDKDDLAQYSSQSTRQYYCGYLISEANQANITIRIDNSLKNQSDWETAIHNAIHAWNTHAFCNLFMKVVETNTADITISRVSNQGYIASASWPLLNGKPGKTVVVNTDYNYYTIGKKSWVMIHELGHNIGLRHTDYMNRNNQGGNEGNRFTYNGVTYDAIHIPGTPNTNSDNTSIMWSTVSSQSWPTHSFSNYDRIALTALYPLKSIVPCPADYDGDGITDIAVKTNNGTWYIDYSSNGFGKWDETPGGFGGTDCIPCPGDYNGDGKADRAIFCNDGRFLIDYTDGGPGFDWVGEGYGGPGDIPCPADYDGDGKTDIAIKTTSGIWYIDYSSNGFGSWDESPGGFGGPDCTPCPGDYNGDGYADRAIRTSGGMWQIDYSYGGPGFDWVGAGFGIASDIACPADYNGDGQTDRAIKRANGEWWIDYVDGGPGYDWTGAGFGGPDCIPCPGDYNGDGKADRAILCGDGRFLIDYTDGGPGYDWTGNLYTFF